MAVTNTLPPCGPYRTSQPLPGHEDSIGAGILVYLHNHSDAAPPTVSAPDHNILNRWHFHSDGISVPEAAWLDSLIRLPKEGFYALATRFNFVGGALPKGLLVQLGYNRTGQAIIFAAQQRADLQENDLFFSEQGVAISDQQLALLDPLGIVIEAPGPGAHTAGTH